MNKFNTRVLIVDDQDEIHIDFQEILGEKNRKAASDNLADVFLPDSTQPSKNYLPSFELSHASSGAEAYQMVKDATESKQPFAVAFIDIRMPPGIDGVETIRRIREFEKNLEIVIMTAYTDKPLHEIVTNMELLHKLLYIRKPAAREEIQQITLSLVEKWNVEQESRKHQQLLDLSYQRLKAVLDATGDAIGVLDRDNQLLFANQQYCQLFDISTQDFKQLSPEDLNSRVESRFRKVDTSEVDHIIEPFENSTDVLEVVEDTDQNEPRLFYSLTTPLNKNEDEISDKVVSYRDMSKDIEIQHIAAELLSLRAELQKNYAFDEIIGKSKKMQQLFTQIQTAAEGTISVLIQGESGTGKELVAKSIHYNSARKNGPFIAVNCAAIPETLIESELFGHERGAFTGATERRIGKFEQANHGTLFLDEIGDMELTLQVKLLRVLEDHQFQRVGGTSTISTDIRVLTATNRDLTDAIDRGDFRPDLFYRIAGFQIHLPPLRERSEDIAILANHFLKKSTATSGKSIRAISTDALQTLIQYDYPGNVRELENAIESAVLVETSELLQRRSLPLHLLQANPQTDIAAPTDTGIILPLDEVERRTIQHALEVIDNNVSRAARALGVDRSTLHRKLKKYRILD
ncbi:response regulator [Candidatus Poribacteria bacterium]|nr:response regulator [Candidatus Poribacteria bacterium]